MELLSYLFHQDENDIDITKFSKILKYHKFFKKRFLIIRKYEFFSHLSPTKTKLKNYFLRK